MAVSDALIKCLTDYIGIYSCTEVVPESGLYINQLPGISNEVIQAITEPEDETYLKSWNEIQLRTILMFRTQFMTAVNKCFQVNDITQIECLACENKDLLAVAYWYLLGYNVMNQALANWNNSRFTTVDINNVTQVRDGFYSQFVTEITAATQGINIVDSDCINTCVPESGPISYRWSVM